jgi:transmembrane sensor
MPTNRTDLKLPPEGLRPSRAVVAEAAHWADRVAGQDEFGDEERERFRRWLRADPAHLREYRAQIAINHAARNLSPEVKARLVASIHPGQRSRRGVPSWWLWGGALVAVLLLAFIGNKWLVSRDSLESMDTYSTRTAETRTIQLKDGSVTVLNTRTQLRWAVTPRERRVDLIEGEAFFQVAHDAVHPFRVIVDHSRIQAVGTQFDVYHKDHDTILIVLEGAVDVAPVVPEGVSPPWTRRVQAHQQVEYRGSQIVRDVCQADEGALNWRQGIVSLRESPLPDVIQELQRYTDRRIVIDPALAGATAGGTYNIHDIGAALAKIAKFVPMTIRAEGETIVLSPPNPEVEARPEGRSNDNHKP